MWVLNMFVAKKAFIKYYDLKALKVFTADIGHVFFRN